MRFDPDKHHRQSIRLQGYDYSQAGAYFVTVCTQGRSCLFGDVVDGVMRLNEAGRVIERWWLELENKFPLLEIDEYVVMPNHFHGIIIIVGADLRVRPDSLRDPATPPDTGATLRARSDPRGPAQGAHTGAPLQKTLQWFKTMTTNEYINGVKQRGWPPFPGRLWQRNYYEHIIRNERELNLIRQYIVDNPAQWALDRENPMTRRGVLQYAPTDDIEKIFGGERP